MPVTQLPISARTRALIDSPHYIPSQKIRAIFKDLEHLDVFPTRWAIKDLLSQVTRLYEDPRSPPWSPLVKEPAEQLPVSLLRVIETEKWFLFQLALRMLLRRLQYEKRHAQESLPDSPTHYALTPHRPTPRLRNYL